VEIDIRLDCSEVNWSVVSETLKRVGMAYHDPDIHRRAFENSYVTAFAYRGGELVGFGRAISDGTYQAAIYDVAVIPELQRSGVGTAILKCLLSRLSQCHVILYASPGKEPFYRRLGLRAMKTGMALFRNAEQMRLRGFTD
jgi:ribosomal protein S18 acetylase RimI-like enzyme